VQNSRVATLSALLGLASVAAFAVGPLGIHIGVFTPFIGFRIFGLGLLFGLLALVLGMAGLWFTRAATGRDGRGRAGVGAACGLVIVGIVASVALPSGSLPVINDITTDPDDPPQFSVAQKIPANVGRDLSYPNDFAPQQRAGYPDLAPITVTEPPDEVRITAEGVAQQLGWEITYRDAGAGIFEAVQVTRIFRFVDDIVVRVRPSNGGSIVDVRSKSRDGRGDMGANAARIRAFRDKLAR
jgi:uncharacterized protein (DUF1499 family)